LVTVWVYEPFLQFSAWYWAYAWLAWAEEPGLAAAVDEELALLDEEAAADALLDALLVVFAEALVVAASAFATWDSDCPLAFAVVLAEELALAVLDADALPVAFAVEVPLDEALGDVVVAAVDAAEVSTGRKYSLAVAPMESTVDCEYWPGISTSIVFAPSWVTVASLTP
jgi:hypothetical protein